MKQIQVTGMSCSHCVAAVTSALEELGLRNVQVDLASGVATFDPSDIESSKLAEAIDDVGFSVAEIQ